MSHKIKVKAIALHAGDVFNNDRVITRIEVTTGRVIISYREACIIHGKPGLISYVRDEEPNKEYVVER